MTAMSCHCVPLGGCPGVPGSPCNPGDSLDAPHQANHSVHNPLDEPKGEWKERESTVRIDVSRGCVS